MSKKNLTHPNPRYRWSIAKAIYCLAVAFFSGMPRQLWNKMVDSNALTLLPCTHFMPDLWRITTTTAIRVRCAELEMEQKTLAYQGEKSKRKNQKIQGLRLLESEIKINDPALLNALINQAIIKFPELPAGFFSTRTATLFHELATMTPVFH